MVTFENVSYTYQTGMEMSTSTAVLTDVNLHIGKGECVVLCGRSGCGKTTMLRLVNGLAPHFYAGNLQGAVSVAGMDIPSSDLPEISKIEELIAKQGEYARMWTEYQKSIRWQIKYKRKEKVSC